jgi:hypothetical protein
MLGESYAYYGDRVSIMSPMRSTTNAGLVYRSLVVLIAMIVGAGALRAFGDATTPGTLTWNLYATQRLPTVYSTPLTPQAIPSDVLITHITAHGDMPTLSAGDFCLQFWSDSVPGFPLVSASYGEVDCWSDMQTLQSGAGPWDIDVDFSATPLYVPAGSTIEVGSNLYSAFGTATDQYHFTATITTIPYVSGMARYRSLRIPYADQVNLNIAPGPPPNGLVPPDSIYQSSEQMPLDVEAAQVYVSFNGPVTSGSNVACLQWTHNGTLAEPQCFPPQNPSGGAWDTPPMLTGLGWQLPVGDTLSLNASGGSTDTATYLFVKIPDQIPSGLASIFENYDNIPQANLQEYCANYNTLFTNVSLKGNIANCLSLYPPASSNNPALDWTPNTVGGQTDDPTNTHDWNVSFEILSGFSGSPGYYQNFSFAPSTSYQWSAWVKTQNNQNPLGVAAFLPPGASGPVASSVSGNGNSYALVTLPVGTNDWTRITTNFTTGQGGPGLIMAIVDGTSQGTIWMDGVSVQPTATLPAPPIINSFSASQMSIVQGESVTLSWNVTGDTSLYVDNGLGSVTGLLSAIVSPSQTTTYTLTASNAGGLAAKTITVTVGPPALRHLRPSH